MPGTLLEDMDSLRFAGHSTLLLWFIVTMLILIAAWLVAFLRPADPRASKSLLRSLGVAVRRIPRVLAEATRKAFHFLGAAVPVIYYAGQTIRLPLPEDPQGPQDNAFPAAPAGSKSLLLHALDGTALGAWLASLDAGSGSAGAGAIDHAIDVGGAAYGHGGLNGGAGVDGGPLIPRSTAAVVLAWLSLAQLAVEQLRRSSPRFNAWFCAAAGPMLREKERNGEVTAVTSYLLGCALSVALFPPPVAIASILYLVLGDGAAALVGVSFGRTKIMGGKKSLEGSLAMFAVCFVVGAALLHTAAGAFEMVVIVGAAAATFAELYPVLGDDNISIPVISGFAVCAAAWRMGIPIPQLHH